MSPDIFTALASIIALMIAIIGHEIMHGWVAFKYGDTTAKDAGRLTLNPIKHIDPIGSILVPGLLFLAHAPFLFGWAKPVPINARAVLDRGGYKAMMQVSLAGIAYNLVMATLASIVLLSLNKPNLDQMTLDTFIFITLYMTVMINIVLAVFNMWPIPQFDGAHFLSYLGLQMGSAKIAQFYNKYDRYGMFIVLIILMIPGLSKYLFLPAVWIKQLLLY
ncbi:MAG: site-2 protease family protein [Thiovulaceae bacterium]|nr:site-2 protease family protein [Sulfurimonadaceae bacterium]